MKKEIKEKKDKLAPLVTKDREETPGPQACLGKMAKQGILGSQDPKVTQALAEPQVLQDFLDPKDRLVEWACQDPPERKVCLESPAPRGSLAYLERKEPKGRRDRPACLALDFRDCLGKRETKGWQVFRAVLERREKRGASGSRACPGLPAPKDRQGALATQEALGCLEKKVTKASPDWTVSLASKENQVFLDSLARWGRPARKESPATMGFQGRRERRVNQVYPEEAPQGSQDPKERKAQRVKWASQD